MRDTTVKTQSLVRSISILVVAAIIVRVVFFLALGEGGYIQSDSLSYIAPAQSLIDSGNFLDASGTPEVRRTPGYPVFIAISLLIGTGEIGVLALQYALSLGLAAMIAFLLRKETTPTILIGFGVTALNFILSLYSNFILSEIEYAVFVTASFYALIVAKDAHNRPLAIILAALFAGYASLVRPIGMLLWLPAIIYILSCIPRRKILLSILFFSVCILFPASWSVRNHSYTETYSISDIGNYNLLAYMGAGTLAVQDPDPRAIALQKNQQFLSQEAQIKYQEEKANNPDADINSVYKEMAIEIVKNHPIDYLITIALNAGDTLLGNASVYLSKITGFSVSFARFLCLIYTVPALLLTVGGLLISWKHARHLTVLSVLFIGYHVAIPAVTGVGGSRFRLPVEPLFCLNIAIAITHIYDRLKHKE